ncbi:MAG: glycosyltransferase [Burkholderiaceae bacterium]|uniref:glycosyltransferase n=1 Tax=Polaromonas sp. YR568 TaxID=1855301 RepID=UPI0027278210|nr:glycosyltransferase [Burkholderiaceae bacterium]MDO9316906.1 glycosyltransferase [Gammaproteobacteria bacterium]
MADQSGVIFIENYIAGGGDQIARALIDNLPFKRLSVLVNRGNDTRILLAGTLPPHVRVERYGLVTVAELSRWANAVTNPLLRALARGASFALRYPLVLFSIPYFRARLKRIGADVFVANNGGYPGGIYCRTATVAASLLSGLRVFHVVHGMAEPARGASRPFEWCLDWLIDRRSRLLTVSRACAERLAAVRSMRQRSGVIYNGIADLPPSRATESAMLRVLHVGYFDWNKNQRLLIEALAELGGRGVGGIEVQFVGADVGDGCMAHCRALATALGVAGQVRFSGFINAIEACYAEADVLVLCSHSEGFPMSIIEAMRAGKPVVATDVGGIAEQIEDGVSGFLVPVDAAAALADRLEQLKQDPALRARLGCAARTRFEAAFTTSTMIAEYVKAFELSA